jgi:hypothetical protein
MTLDDQIRATELDLQAKLSRRDWHGVSDAANDLRVLEATRDAHGPTVRAFRDYVDRYVSQLRAKPVCPHCLTRHSNLAGCPVRG